MPGRSNTTDNRNHHRTMHTQSAFGLHVDEDDLFKSDKEEEEDIERWTVHQARCRSVWRMGGIHPLSILITKCGLNEHFSRTRTVLQITFHYPQQPRTTSTTPPPKKKKSCRGYHLHVLLQSELPLDAIYLWMDLIPRVAVPQMLLFLIPYQIPKV